MSAKSLFLAAVVSSVLAVVMYVAPGATPCAYAQEPSSETTAEFTVTTKAGGLFSPSITLKQEKTKAKLQGTHTYKYKDVKCYGTFDVYVDGVYDGRWDDGSYKINKLKRGATTTIRVVYNKSETEYDLMYPWHLGDQLIDLGEHTWSVKKSSGVKKVSLT